jgi:hypothetical protein
MKHRLKCALEKSVVYRLVCNAMGYTPSEPLYRKHGFRDQKWTRAVEQEEMKGEATSIIASLSGV